MPKYMLSSYLCYFNNTVFNQKSSLHGISKFKGGRESVYEQKVSQNKKLSFCNISL